MDLIHQVNISIITYLWSMHDLGSKPSLSNPDTWMKPEVKPFIYNYYVYLTNCMDYCMQISDD